jgi:hypothetical protein
MRIAVVAFAALGGAALASTTASAMPIEISNPNELVGQTSNIQQVRWVCGPWGRCVWRPGWPGAFAWGAGVILRARHSIEHFADALTVRRGSSISLFLAVPRPHYPYPSILGRNR